MKKFETKILVVSCYYYEFEERVNELLANGWELHGNTLIKEGRNNEADYMRQVMIKETINININPKNKKTTWKKCKSWDTSAKMPL